MNQTMRDIYYDAVNWCPYKLKVVERRGNSFHIIAYFFNEVTEKLIEAGVYEFEDMLQHGGVHHYYLEE